MTHVMIDLETWGTASNAVIISIGAVKFDPDADAGYGEKFYVGVDPRSYNQFKSLFDISTDTVMWWMDEARAEARREWLSLQKLDLATALDGFSMWWAGDRGLKADEPEAIWSNGATFDIAIMRRTYELLGLVCPWTFRQENCYRTMRNQFGGRIQLPPAKGVLHGALSDAEWQVDALRALMRASDRV